jgi:hypothetical protein
MLVQPYSEPNILVDGKVVLSNNLQERKLKREELIIVIHPIHTGTPTKKYVVYKDTCFQKDD